MFLEKQKEYFNLEIKGYYEIGLLENCLIYCIYLWFLYKAPKQDQSYIMVNIFLSSILPAREKGRASAGMESR